MTAKSRLMLSSDFPVEENINMCSDIIHLLEIISRLTLRHVGQFDHGSSIRPRQPKTTITNQLIDHSARYRPLHSLSLHVIAALLLYSLHHQVQALTAFPLNLPVGDLRHAGWSSTTPRIATTRFSEYVPSTPFFLALFLLLRIACLGSAGSSSVHERRT
jgi:hypothetical protein